MPNKKDILKGEIGRPGLLWIDHPDEPLECDWCDNIKPLAHIEWLNGNVICICQQCLQTFANAFNQEDMNKPEFTNDPIPIDVMKDIETEPCVSCGVDTKVPKSLHIDQRAYYVEGSGQLCKTCFDKIYKP